jgi:transposase
LKLLTKNLGVGTQNPAWLPQGSDSRGADQGTRASAGGGWSTKTLLAQTAVSKYSEHMPLNRQALVMARHGLPVHRSVLALRAIPVATLTPHPALSKCNFLT